MSERIYLIRVVSVEGADEDEKRLVAQHLTDLPPQYDSEYAANSNASTLSKLDCVDFVEVRQLRMTVISTWKKGGRQ